MGLAKHVAIRMFTAFARHQRTRRSVDDAAILDPVIALEQPHAELQLLIEYVRLRGHASDQVVARGHEKLSTFGLLPHASVAEVRGYIQQLTAFGLLRMTDDAYAVLALTAKGLALLKDEASCPGLTLARQRTPRKDAPRARSRVETESWQDVDRALFERLRAVRLETARQRGVPPYVIFHDATLREMARLRPTSIDALLSVKGVGARKADDLGEIFLSAIRGHAQPGSRSA